MTLTDRRSGYTEGLAIKRPCVAATTGNITLNGEQTIDGVAVVSGNRVLVKNQTNGVNNGIYVVSTGDWTRAVDFDGTGDVVSGTAVHVNNGVVAVDLYYISTADPIIIGTTSIAFEVNTASPSGRTALAANTTMYVRSDGSDSNDGLTNSSGGAKLTWNALYTAATAFDFKGYTVTLKSGTTNTYASGLTMGSAWTGGGALIIDLNGSSIAETTTKGIINNVIQPGPITITNSAGAGVGGKVSSSGFAGIQMSVPGIMYIGSGMETGTCFDAAYEAIQGGEIALTASVRTSGGNGNCFVLTATGGNFGFNGQTVNFRSSRTYSTATIAATYNSTILSNSATFDLSPSGAGGPFVVTGPRYLASNGYIYTGGAGASFIPGTTAGTVDSGGNYDTTGSPATVTSLDSGTAMAGSLLVTNIAAPSSPVAGKLSIYGDSTALTFQAKNSAGAVTTMVFPQAAAGSLFVTGLSTSGGLLTAQPAVSNLSGFGTGVATALGGNVGTAGAPVVNGGALGTPSSGTLTSATGLPLSTGISGAGTGVLTALGVNVGTAGSVVVNGGALGSPSSVGTLPAHTLGGTITGAGQTVSGVGPLSATSVTATSHYGGSATGSTVTLASTSNGSPSGDIANITASTINLIAPAGIATTVNIGAAGAQAGSINFNGSTSGATAVKAAATASGTLTLPTGTDTIMSNAFAATMTNKTFNSTGTGNVLQVSGVTVSAGQYPGETTTGSATAGNVGEYVTSSVAAGSAVALTVSGTTYNVVAGGLSLTAGDWDVTAQVYVTMAASTSYTNVNYSISGTSATQDFNPGRWINFSTPAAVIGNTHITFGAVTYRISLSATTTIYLPATATFTVSTAAAWGFIGARRAR